MSANTKLRGAPFFLAILGMLDLQERVSKIEVSEALLEPFTIKVSIVPSKNMPLEAPLLNGPALLMFIPDKLNQEHYSFPVGKLVQYCGYVAEEKRIYGADSKLIGIEATIKHPLYLMEKGAHARIFSINTETPKEGENKLEDIFEAVFAPYKDLFTMYGILGIVYDKFPQTPIPYLTQFGETDLGFIFRLCETYGLHFVQHGPLLLFKSTESLPTSFHIAPPPSEFQWEYHSTNASCVLQSRDLSYVNPYSDVPQVPVAKCELKQEPIERYVLRHHDTKNEGEEILAIMAQHLAHRESELHVWSELKEVPNSKPIVGIRAGDCVILPKLIIPSLVHRASWSYQSIEPVGGEGIEVPNIETYRTDFFGREITVPYVPPPLHPKYSAPGWQKAIVIAPAIPDRADKDQQLGRIKVRFLWDQSQTQRLVDRPEYTCWIRLVMPYAGPNHGFYSMPEVGDEVIVSFESGDMDRPLCLGSVYNVESHFLSQSLTAMQPNNHIAQMETARLKTPKNLSLEFWEAEEEKKQRIELAADRKIVLNMVIDGKTIAYILDSKGTISVHSVGEMTEDSDTQVLIKRGDAGSIKIDKEGNIEIKGKTLKIETTDNTEVKAALIKLNC